MSFFDLCEVSSLFLVNYSLFPVTCSHCFYVNLFVLRFHGPVNQMGSCRARSVYITTLILGRLCPLRG